MILRHAGKVADLVNRFGVHEGLRLAILVWRGRGALKFTDEGKRYVMPNDHSASQHLVESMPKLRKLAAYVRPADRVIIDVGAHAGLFSAFAKERARSAKVICIEPDSSLSPLIAANMSDFDDWEIIVAAAMDRPGTVTLYRSALSTQTSSVHRSAVELFQPDAQPQSAPAITLDEVASEYDAVDVLKIDVQGAESLVLAGGRATLRKTRTVLIEATLLDPDPASVLTTLQDEFGPWHVVNVVVSGADLAFQRGTE